MRESMGMYIYTHIKCIAFAVFWTKPAMSPDQNSAAAVGTLALLSAFAVGMPTPDATGMPTAEAAGMPTAEAADAADARWRAGEARAAARRETPSCRRVAAARTAAGATPFSATRAAGTAARAAEPTTTIGAFEVVPSACRKWNSVCIEVKKPGPLTHSVPVSLFSQPACRWPP